MVAPAPGASPIVGRASALQPLNASAALHWQHYFQLDGSAMQLTIDMADAAVAPVATPGAAAVPQQPPVAELCSAAASPPEEPSSAAAHLELAQPATAAAAAPAASELPPPAALDHSMPAFLQAVRPACAIPAVAGPQRAAAAAAEGSRPTASLAPLALALLPAPLAALLAHADAPLWLAGAAVLELLLIAGLLLLWGRRGSARASPTEPGAASSPSSPQQPSPARPRRSLRDACCSPMVPAAQLVGSAVQALARSSPVVARLFSIPEEQEHEDTAAGQDLAAAGCWTRWGVW